MRPEVRKSNIHPKALAPVEGPGGAPTQLVVGVVALTRRSRRLNADVAAMK